MPKRSYKKDISSEQIPLHSRGTKKGEKIRPSHGRCERQYMWAGAEMTIRINKFTVHRGRERRK